MSKKPSKVSNSAKAAKLAAKTTSTKRKQQNGITRPGAGTLCARVWEAIEKLRAKGTEVSFCAVRDLAGDKMADATIRTQRQRFNEFHGISRDTQKPAPKRKAEAAKQASSPAVVTAEAQPTA